MGKDGDSGRAAAVPMVQDGDPTRDIVRRMIERAEAIPAPALKPKGRATPRPDRADPIPSPRVPVADAAPQEWSFDASDDAQEEISSGPADDAFGARDGDMDDLGDAADLAPPDDGLLRRLLQAVGQWALARCAAVLARVKLFLKRPDAPRKLAVALLVVFVMAWPWSALKISLLIPIGLAVTWASVGSDGLVELVVRWHSRLRERDPDKAEKIRSRAAAVTRFLNRGIERLPENWTRGLYLPDFETDGYVPEKLMVDPFEDFAAEVRQAKRAGGRV